MTQQVYRVYYEDNGQVDIFEMGGISFCIHQVNLVSFDADSGGQDVEISQLPGGITEIKIELLDDVVGCNWKWDFSSIEPGNEIALISIPTGESNPTILEGSIVSQNGKILTIDLSALAVGTTHIRFNQ